MMLSRYKLLDFRKKEWFSLFIKYCFLAWVILTFAAILLLDLFSQNQLTDLLLPCCTILLIAVVAILFVRYLLPKIRVPAFSLTSKWILIAFIGVDLIVLALQIFIASKIYFRTNWDVNTLISAANLLANGQPFDNWLYEYFSRYPNNVFLLRVFALFIRATSVFGPDYYWHLVVFNIVLINGSGLLLAFAANNFMKSGSAALYCYIVYLLLIGFSGWMVIPYSDTFALPFTTLLLLLFSLNTRPGTVPCHLRNLFIGIVSVLGYNVKPTAIFLLVALLLCELVLLIRSRAKVAEYTEFVSLLLGALLSRFIVSAFTYSIQRQLNPIRAFSLFHYLMMGLNKNSLGSFWNDDVETSAGVPSYLLRIAYNLGESLVRFSEYGFFGWLKLIFTKNALNYNDGLFAWGKEGDFFKETFPSDSSLTETIRSFYYFGENSAALDFSHTLCTFLLYFVLLSTLFLFGKKQKCRDILPILIAVLGLSLFLMLFERRARYILLYIPYYIFLSSLALYKIKHRST